MSARANFMPDPPTSNTPRLTDLSNPIFHDFKKAVTFCAQKVIAQITLLSENQTTHKKQLFDGLHPAAHNRVQTALKNTSK